MTKRELQEALENSGIGFSKKATKDALLGLYMEHIDNIQMDNEITDEDIEIAPEQEVLEVKIKGYEATYISKGRTFSLGVFKSEKEATIALNKAGASIRKILIK